MKVAALIPSLILTISLLACSAETSKNNEIPQSAEMDKSEAVATSKPNVTTKSVEANKSKTALKSKRVDPVASDSLIFDINGLKIGMTQSEVEDIAIKNGYSPKISSRTKSNISPGLSFEQSVKKHMGKYVDRKKYEGISGLSFHKDDREFLEVIFIPFKEAARVISVKYKLKDANMAPEDFQDRMVAKYGEAHGERHGRGVWIGAQNYQIESIRASEHLVLTSFGQNRYGQAENSFSLNATIDEKAYDKVLDAAIPKSKGDTTF